MSGELYSVSVPGGTPSKLAGNVADFSGYTNIPNFLISSDSSFVVFANVMKDLQLIPVAGGTAVSLGSDFSASQYKISPDSSFIAYKDSTSDLFVIPNAGGTPRKLNISSGSGEFQFTSDSQFIIYQDRVAGSTTMDLYSSPLAAGASTKIGVNVVSFSQPDSGDLVLYMDGDDTLFSVPVSGGTAVSLSKVKRYEVSGDSSTVVYSDVLKDLYSVPISGGTSVKIGSNNVANPQYSSFRITPDSSRVVFISGSVSVAGNCALSSMPISGGTAVNISNAVRCDKDPVLGVSPDSSLIVFSDQQNGVNTALLSGAGETRIGDYYSLPGLSGISSVNFSPDSNWISYSNSTYLSSMYYYLNARNLVLYQVP